MNEKGKVSRNLSCPFFPAFLDEAQKGEVKPAARTWSIGLLKTIFNRNVKTFEL